MKYLLLTIVILLHFSYSNADTWLPPKTKDYYSTDSSYFVRIVPRCVPEKYWKWVEASPKKKKRFSPQDTTVVPCHTMMFKRTKQGDSLIWKEKLINQIAPVSAIVSNDGQYLITFDNWHSLGYGIDVMVIYDKDGMMLKRHKLEDISPFPINTYTMSISSIWWNCGHQMIDSEKIEICFGTEDEKKESGVYLLTELKMEENAP